MISSILARDECEKYCNATADCWGCTLNCEKDCNWIAITKCNEIELVGPEKGGLTQKPGNHVTISLFLTFIFILYSSSFH